MDYPGQNLVFTLNVPSDGNDGTATDVSTAVGLMSVEISGDFDGSYIILGSHDGTNYVPLATFEGGGDVKQTISFFPHMSAQAGGPFDEPAGIPTHFLKVRRRSSGGTVSIIVGAGTSLTLNAFVALATVAPNASGPQAITDLFAVVAPTGFFPGFSVFCVGAFLGGDIVLEGSLNGVNFAPVAQFTSPGFLPNNTQFPPIIIQQVIRYIRLNIRATVTGNTFITLGGAVATNAALGVVSLTADRGIILLGTPANPIVATTADVPNIAALKAQDVTKVRAGQPLWVATKKAGYDYDPLAATVAGDDNFYVAPTAGIGMYSRILSPVPEWQTKATNGTGIFIDPVAGNDENVGDIGTPIKTMREFNARLFGAELTTSPRLTVLGVGSANAQDAIIAGWRTTGAAKFILIGVETVVQAGVVLSAAANMNPAVSEGFISSVATNFGASGFVSTAARTLWARRVNLVGGLTTYAALYRTFGAGPFSADVSLQVQFNPITAVAAPTVQPFAAADVVDLVSLPVWPSLISDPGIAVVAPARLDFASSFNIIGAEIVNADIIGHRGSLSVQPGCSYNPQGVQMNGSVTVFAAARISAQDFNVGAQGLALATINILGNALLNRFSMDTAALAIDGGRIDATGNQWAQNLALIVTAQKGGRHFQAGTMGIGLAVVAAATVATAATVNGAANFSVAVNPFTSGTPYSLPSGAVAFAALGVLDVNTLAAIVL